MDIDPIVNPHADIAPWASKLLSGPNLAKGVRNLVILLRVSLPVILELEALRLAHAESMSRSVVDWFPKGIAWWRFMLGDMR